MPIQFHTLCQEVSLYDAWNTIKAKGSSGASGKTGGTSGRLGKYLSALSRLLCPHRIYSATEEERPGKNSGRIKLVFALSSLTC